MAGFTTLALASLAASAYQGEAQKRAAKKANVLQERAQRQAEADTIRQERQAEMERNKADAKRPDLETLLAAEQSTMLGGSAGTMLTGQSGAGVDPQKLKLGRSTLLGG